MRGEIKESFIIPREARLINLSGRAEGPSEAKPRQFERKKKKRYIYSNRLEDKLASAVCWSKTCIHREVSRSAPDQISTAMFININWMEISLQNLFPFFQKSFL